MKNIMEKTADVEFNPRYDMSARDLLKILNENGSGAGAVIGGFRFGYMQGYKAAKAETRGNKKAVIEMVAAINNEQAIQRIYNLVYYFYMKGDE